MTTEQFHWTSKGGAEITLPHIRNVKAGVLRRHRTKDATDMMFSILEDVADDETLAKIDDLGSDELNDLAEAWQESVNAGESVRSSTS